METISIKALKKGCHQTFKLMFDAYWGKAYHYLHKRTRDTEEAMELTQEVFIKFWKYRSSLSEELCLDEQLFRKCKQVFIDWLRRQARDRSYLVEVDDQFDIADDYNLEKQYSLKHDIYNAIAKLPQRRKEIFELKHIHGYSYKEIADKLGISVKTVDNQLLKANIQLREILYTSICIMLGTSLIN